MSSTSLVRSLSTGSPYWRMVKFGMRPSYRRCPRGPDGPRRSTRVTRSERGGSTSTRRPRPDGRAAGPAGRTAGGACRPAGESVRRPGGGHRAGGGGGARPLNLEASAAAYASGERPDTGSAQRKGATPRCGGSPLVGQYRRRVAQCDRRSSGCSGTRVWACRRAHGGRRRGRHQAGGPDEQRQVSSSVADRRGASRWRSMSRKTTAAARRTRWRTASVPMRTGLAAPVRSRRRLRPRHLPHFGAEKRRQLLAQPAHPRPQRLHPQPAAGRAHDGTGLVATRAAQHLSPPGCAMAAPQRAAARELATVPAGQQAGAARPVVDADERTARGPVGIVEDGPGQPDELFGEHPAARVAPAPVDPLEDGPARPLLGTRRGDGPHDRSAASATGGTGDARMQGTPSRRARSITTSTAPYVGALSSR